MQIVSKLRDDRNIVTTNGSGERLGVSVHGRVYAGPKPTLERDTVLHMDIEEALGLAAALVGQLPAMYLSKHHDQLSKLRKYIDMAMVDQEVGAT